MKVCVFGAGAVGGYLAAKLLSSGIRQVSVVARGEHLKAIRDGGLRLEGDGPDVRVAPLDATDDPARLPPQDVVLVTLKATAQPATAAAVARLLAPDGVAVYASNGIPWWWNHGIAGRGGPLPLLDPDSALWSTITPERVLGCVVYSANAVVRPGVVRHMANNHWLLGEPDRRHTPRLDAVVKLLCMGGLNAEAVDDLRKQVWIKLLRNAAISPICALTRLPVDALSSIPDLASMVDDVVDEVVAIAAAHGWSIDQRHADAARMAPRLGGNVGDGLVVQGMRPSMLQDVEAGRPMEVEPILGQTQAFARESLTPCPTVDALVALLRGLDHAVGGRRTVRVVKR